MLARLTSRERVWPLTIIIINQSMKSLRFLPLCLAALALPLVMTGCNNAGTSTASTDTNAAPADTNTPPAAADTNAPAPAPADTNATPAKVDTNAAPPASTNSGT
jgi:hypothetical protein